MKNIKVKDASKEEVEVKLSENCSVKLDFSKVWI